MSGMIPKSKGEMQIERLLEELDPNSERYRILATAHRFKSSWVELGEKLLAVQGHALYREWGYASFEDYCGREIRIRRGTAEKLTQAYRFLEREEPELLARQTELNPPPDFQAVDLLRRAREEQALPEDSFAELRRGVVESALSAPTLRKRLRTLQEPKLSVEERRAMSLRSALSALQRLQTAMAALPELENRHAHALSHLQAELAALLPDEPPPEARPTPAPFD